MLTHKCSWFNSYSCPPLLPSNMCWLNRSWHFMVWGSVSLHAICHTSCHSQTSLRDPERERESQYPPCSSIAYGSNQISAKQKPGLWTKPSTYFKTCQLSVSVLSSCITITFPIPMPTWQAQYEERGPLEEPRSMACDNHVWLVRFIQRELYYNAHLVFWMYECILGCVYCAWESKTNIPQTGALLTKCQSQLTKTRSHLTQTRSQLTQTGALLTECRSQLTQQDLLFADAESPTLPRTWLKSTNHDFSFNWLSLSFFLRGCNDHHPLPM